MVTSNAVVGSSAIINFGSELGPGEIKIDFMELLIEKGNLGQKTKAGFYKKDEDGDILVLDLESREYIPIGKIELGLDHNIIQNGDIGQQINALINLDSKYGEFLLGILNTNEFTSDFLKPFKDKFFISF